MPKSTRARTFIESLSLKPNTITDSAARPAPIPRIHRPIHHSATAAAPAGCADAAAESHEPVVITGKRTRAVLVAEDDWKAMQETLLLLSVPGMRESIREGMETPVEDCSEPLAW